MDGCLFPPFGLETLLSFIRFLSETMRAELRSESTPDPPQEVTLSTHLRRNAMATEIKTIDQRLRDNARALLSKYPKP